MPSNEKVSAALTELFDIDDTPIEIESKDISVVEEMDVVEGVVEDTQSLDADFEKSKTNINGLIEETTPALKDLIALAKESESARVYEVVATLAKTLADLNKDVLNLHDMRKKILTAPNTRTGKQPNETHQQGGGISVDKAVFVGTTAAFNKMIKEQKKTNGV